MVKQINAGIDYYGPTDMANLISEAAKEIKQLQTKNNELIGLLSVAKCPNCGGFGSYAVPPNGDCEPCQWCYCVKQEIKKVLEGGEK